MALSQDQIKFVTGLLLSIPLSYFLRKLPTTASRYWYSFVLGTLLQLYVYGTDIWMPFVVHLVVYAIIKVKGRKCGALVTGLSIVALSIYHIYRLVVDYGSWILDVSTILMSMVCKYSLFAYSYQDGGQPKQKLNPHQQSFKLQQLPSLFNYLVYCQFLPTCIIGTAIQYKDFDNYMKLEQPFKDIPRKSIWRKVGYEFVYCLVCGTVYIAHMLLFPLSTMQTPQFAHNSLLYIMYYSFICVTLLRFKYYFGWKLSQCAVHASGVSYSGNGQFERVKTCDPYIVQTTLHLREKVAHWNMSSELWLRRCIYERAPFGNKQLNQAYVFAISAFWHGFYGGYYLSFLFWFFQMNLATKVFKFVQQQPDHKYVKLYQKMGYAGYVMLWLFVNFMFTHNGLYFQILDSGLGFEILKQIYFLPPVIVVTLLWYVGTLSKKQKKQKIYAKNPQDKVTPKQA